VGSATSAGPTFKGREEALKEHVYAIVNTNTSASAFITTTEEISEIFGRNLKMGNHVRRSLEQMVYVAVEKSVKPTNVIDSKGNDTGSPDDVDATMLQSSMQKAYSVIY